MLRLRLFLSAFSPMLLIFGIRMTEHSIALALILFALGVIAILSALTLLASRSLTNAQPHTLVAVRDESNQIPAYLLTYLFPFFTVGAEAWQDIAVYGCFALLLAVILLRTDLVLINPVLLAFGYHLYAIRSTTKTEAILLSKKRPAPGQTIQAVHLTKGALKLTSITAE